jgi:uncharacterized protein RhaS with RHS repeats
VGRFVSEDPDGFRSGVNFYRYVLNDPTSLTDPTGLDPNQQSGWWNRFWNWVGNAITPKAVRYGAGLYNLCNNGQNLLFNEASLVNPYYHEQKDGETDPGVQKAIDVGRMPLLTNVTLQSNRVRTRSCSVAIAPLGQTALYLRVHAASTAPKAEAPRRGNRAYASIRGPCASVGPLCFM